MPSHRSLSLPKCICGLGTTEQCQEHPNRTPDARGMFSTPTPGAVIPYFKGSIEESDAQWEVALRAARDGKRKLNRK